MGHPTEEQADAVLAQRATDAGVALTGVSVYKVVMRLCEADAGAAGMEVALIQVDSAMPAYVQTRNDSARGRLR